MADFWQDQTGWPRDTLEMIFLGRAVDQLGRTLFDQEWTGEEPWVETFSYLKIGSNRRATNDFIARYLPQFGRREYHGSMAPPPTGYDDDRPKFEFSAQEYQELQLFIDRHNQAVPPAKKRFMEVQKAIADGAIAGKLGTSFRAIAGGDVSPIQLSWWNTERLERRFATCRINPNDPFGSGGEAWIFVSRIDFESWSQPNATQSTGPRQRRGAPNQYDWDDARQFVIRELNLHGDFDIPANQSEKWRTQTHLVGRLQNYMATRPGGGRMPSDSGAKANVARWVTEWRKAGSQ